MVDQVAPTPPLPPPPAAADLFQLHHWDADVSKALILYLSDMARRTNASFVADGSGTFTGNLDMGGFNIVNAGDITAADDITGLDGFFTNLTVSGTVSGAAFDVFVLVAGDTMTGKLITRTPASGGGTAGLNLPPGSSPDSGDLVNGDIWIVGNSVLVRLGGATRQLMHTNASSAWTAKQTFVTPTTSTASINLPHGTAPTSPADGDVWTTTAGIVARINGVNKTLNDQTAPDASETVKGVVELATTAEAEAGTDTVRAVTPAGLRAATDFLFLESGTAAAVATEDIDLSSYVSAGFEHFMIHVSAEPATDNVDLQLQISTNGGSSFITTSYRRADLAGAGHDSGASAGAIVVARAVGNAAGETAVIDAMFNTGSAIFTANGLGMRINNTGAPGTVVFGGDHATGSVNAIRFLFSSGNLDAIAYTLWGLRDV